MSTIENTVEQLIVPKANELGCEVYDVVYKKQGGRYYLNVYLHKPEGVTFDICEQVNHQLAQLIDRDGVIDGSYVLEVSSRGLERHLRKPEHYAGAVGETLTLKLRKPVNGVRNHTGELVSINQDVIQLSTSDGVVDIDVNGITKCNVVYK